MVKITYEQFKRRHKKNLKKGLTWSAATPCMIEGSDYMIYTMEYGIRGNLGSWHDIDEFDVLIEMKDFKFVEFQDLMTNTNIPK